MTRKLNRHVILVAVSVAVFLVLLSAPGVHAQTNNDETLRWRDARELRVEGRGWTDIREFFDRLPARAEKNVRPAVWNLSRDSAGMCVRFVTDATLIAARWQLRKDALAMPHMPATGVSGLDLYVKAKGGWRWLGNGRPASKSEEKVLVRGLKPELREYLLYLPLYNGVEGVNIGVPQVAHLESGSRLGANAKPVVFYGTSIVQGGCASRPGMAYPAILGRHLDVPTINLGFSGNAQCEPEIAELLAELDPAAFVLDPLPNMNEQMVAERFERFVLILRDARPTTPIVLIENVEYTDGEFVEARLTRVASANSKLREIYKRLTKSGEKRLFYVPAAKLIGGDGEGTVDGTHPTDLGFMRMADAIEPALSRALKARR